MPIRDDHDPREPHPTAPQVSIGRLPATGSDLFGRDRELAWLDTCWDQRVHVASIVAWGGVGKSALVNKWLARLRDAGWRGAEKVFGWSFYSQGTDRLSSSDEFIDAALRWFGDADPNVGSPWDKGERLAALVGKQRTILVLDGVEPLQWGPGVEQGKVKDPALQALVKELGGQNRGLCLITSRIHMTDLEALAGDKVQAHGLNNLSAEAGAELLKTRGAKGLEEELQAAAKEYDGHSFALTLLGTYIRNAHKGDIRKRELIPPLVGRPAHRMMAIYERWFAEKPELAILRMLGLFDRPAPKDEISVLREPPTIVGLTDSLQVEGEKRWYHFLFGPPKQPLTESGWNEAVTVLCNVGLLAGSETEEAERLDAHPLVREHFAEQLRREQPEAWREGHRRLYEHLKQKAKELPGTLEEMAPLYAAVVHGCLAGKTGEAEEIYHHRIQRGAEFFNSNVLGAFGSEITILSSFFDPPWERLAPGLSEEIEAWVLNEAGFDLLVLGRLSEAGGLLRMALDRDVTLGNWTNAAVVTSNMSQLLQTRGELREALEQVRRSVDLADKSGFHEVRVRNRTMLAATLHAMGRREEAAAQFEEAERMENQGEPAHPLASGAPSFKYCDFLLDQGRDADVRVRAGQTLRSGKMRGSRLDVACDHLSIGLAHLLAAERGASGDLAQAASHLAASVDGLRSAGQQNELPRGLLARAALHTHTRAFALARKDLDEALTLATRCGFRLHEADARLGYARLCLAEGAPAAAGAHLASARKLIEATGYHRRDEKLAGLEAEAAEMAKAPPPAVPSPPPPAPRPAPMPDKPIAAQPVDIGIIVALMEEARALLSLAGEYTPRDDGGMSSFLFMRGGYACVVTLVGAMGETEATRVTERQIGLFDPQCVVSIGISGGVHDDLRVGDVYVPTQAVQYLQDAKAAPAKPRRFVFVPGAPASRADDLLHTVARGFELNKPAAYQTWREEARKDLEALLPDGAVRERLFAQDLVRPDVVLLADGHEASGPVVSTASAFSAFIRSHDRNVKAIDMESGAVLRAAEARPDRRRGIVLRGISDYGDPRKKKLDALGDRALRTYAMRNAVRFLFALLDAGALPHRPR